MMLKVANQKYNISFRDKFENCAQRFWSKHFHSQSAAEDRLQILNSMRIWVRRCTAHSWSTWVDS